MQGLENVLWSFATLNHQPSHKLLLKTAEYMERNLPRYNQQNLALTLWAYAKLGFEVINHLPARMDLSLREINIYIQLLPNFELSMV